MRRNHGWAVLVLLAAGLILSLGAAQARAARPASERAGALLRGPAAGAARLGPHGGGTPTTTPAATATATAPAAGTATATPGACIATFQDVPTEYWAYGYIEWVYCHNIVSGYSCGAGCMEFRPEANTTRAQIAKMLTLGFNFPIVTPPSATFADAPASAWYYPWVESAYARGVFSGYACGGPGEPCDPALRPYFRPSNNVTRAQLAKIIVISAGWTLLTPTTPTFSDVPTNYWAYSFVETAYDEAVIGGYDCLLLTPLPTPQPVCREFRPERDATRAQLSKMIYIAVTPPLKR